METVSYTHLDVYKRQIQDPGVTFFSYPGYYKTIVDNIGIVNGIECSN